MDVQKLTTFFMWCTILNGGLLILMIFSFNLAPDLFYAKYAKGYGLFPKPMERETFNVVWFSALVMWRVGFLIFNAVPLVALLIMR